MEAPNWNAAPETRPQPARQRKSLIFGVTAAVTVAVCFVASRLRAPEGFVAKLFALFLMLGLPALTWLGLKRLRRQQAPAQSRSKLYRSIIFFEWVLAVGAIEILIAQDWELGRVGLRFPGAEVFLGLTLALSLVSFAVVWLFRDIVRRGWLPSESEPDLLRLAPETRSERLACLVVLAPTVGFCEELLYRGYLLHELGAWLHSHPIIWSLLLSSLAFGVAHLGRGLTGILRATVFGALWGYSAIRFGTLYPSMVVHALYDAVVLVWLAPRLLRKSIPEAGL